jgi:4,5:9,10-diseco-3-hydroxy-5,9,17-trioxoandrosta-1(10),2-diene-4-oate hydrolase
MASTTTSGRRSAVGATAPWREVTVDGVRLACDDEGAGPALVCLHAIGHGAGDFARLRRTLRGRHHVLALDWPGQGNSGPDRVPPSAARYAALLAGFLDAVGLERVTLVGNSIGGAAALRFAALHPARVEGLVLENPGGLDAVDRLTPVVVGAMARFFAAGARGAWWFPRAFAAYYRLVLPRPAAAEQRARIVAAASEIAPLLRDAWRGFGAPEADQRALIPRITCPVLFAWAERDRFVQLRRNRAAIARFARARLETFPAGHAAHLETPDAFEASLERFLAGLGSAAAA